MGEGLKVCAECPFREGRRTKRGDFSVHVTIENDGSLFYSGHSDVEVVLGGVTSEQIDVEHPKIVNKAYYCEGPYQRIESMLRSTVLGRILRITDTVMIKECPGLSDSDILQIATGHINAT